MMDAFDCIHTFPGYDPFRDAEDYEFIPELAEAKIDWIESNIVHTEGPLAGKPYLLEPHQRGMQYMLWGWYHKTQGRERKDGEWRGFRRIKEGLYYCSRKGSKSTDCAVILNTIIFTEPDWRMQLYGCASAGRQSAKVASIMAAQIAANDEMAKRARVYEIRKVPVSIVRLADNTSFIPLPDNADVEHGGNVRACLCDEIHTYSSAALPTVMRTGMVAQDEALLLSATTADFLRESYCNQTLAYAKRVRDGVTKNPRFLPMIWEPDAEKLKADPNYWKTEECWREANPMYGIVISKQTMEEEIARAEAQPSYENECKRLLCNIQTDQVEQMISAEVWAKGDGDFPAGHFDGRVPIAASLDLSSSSDTTSFGLLYEGIAGGFEAVWHHWLPQEAAHEQEEKYGRPFSVWGRDGWVRITQGDQIDYAEVRREIVAICEACGITKINVDPLFNAKHICQELQHEDGLEIEYFKTSPVNITAPVEELMRLLKSGQIKHGNNPLMREQAANAMMILKGEDLKHVSKRRSKGQIDGIITLLMNIPAAMAPREKKGSVYETRGFVSFGKG